MSIKKILVTGSTGFIGSYLIPELKIKYDYEVFETTTKINNVTPHKLYLDLNNNRSINEVFENYKFHTIIHLAGISNIETCEKHKEKCYKVNVLGSKYLAESAKKNGVSCFLFFSSNKSVYPKSYYGKCKKEVENIFLELGDNIFNTISYRCGNILASPNSFLQEWKKMYDQNITVESSGKEIYRNFITKEKVISDIIKITSNYKSISKSIIIPSMKRGEIISFLNIFKTIFHCNVKLIPNRKSDNKIDFYLEDDELINTKIIKIKNEKYCQINQNIENKKCDQLLNSIIDNISDKEIIEIIQNL